MFGVHRQRLLQLATSLEGVQLNENKYSINAFDIVRNNSDSSLRSPETPIVVGATPDFEICPIVPAPVLPVNYLGCIMHFDV
jgi:hypothetical protein